jgi:hypothetical protein
MCIRRRRDEIGRDEEAAQAKCGYEIERIRWIMSPVRTGLIYGRDRDQMSSDLTILPSDFLISSLEDQG